MLHIVDFDILLFSVEYLRLVAGQLELLIEDLIVALHQQGGVPEGLAERFKGS